MTADQQQADPGRSRAYWALRVLESALLIAALVGIGLFAFSIFDIVRIESTFVATAAQPAPPLPGSAWPGVFVFFGSLALLQPVRAILMRYRTDGDLRVGADARPEATAVTAAAEATAEVLASLPDDPGPAAEAGS